ncbi:hypothetical protein IAT38_006299 [Cryptococcus sp. DSM 104549]
MTPSITLHHLNASRSARIFWLLEELKLPYDVQVHFRLPTQAAPPSLLAVSLLGRAPALLLDDNLLTESAFIVHTLLALPSVRERAAKGELDVQAEETEDGVFWSHFAEGSQVNLIHADNLVLRGAAIYEKEKGLEGQRKEDLEEFKTWMSKEYLKPEIQKTVDHAEAYLSTHPGGYFSGTDKPGEGDFMMYFALHAFVDGGYANAGYSVGPYVKGWYERVLARPAVQRAMTRVTDEESKAKAAK